MRLLDPGLGEGGADLRFPLRVVVGVGDFAIQRGAVAVLVGHRGIRLRTLAQRHLGGVAHGHHAVAGKAHRAAVEQVAQRALETALHAAADRLGGGGLDADVRRVGGVGGRNQQVEQHRRRLAAVLCRRLLHLRCRRGGRRLVQHVADELVGGLLRSRLGEIHVDGDAADQRHGQRSQNDVDELAHDELLHVKEMEEPATRAPLSGFAATLRGWRPAGGVPGSASPPGSGGRSPAAAASHCLRR